MHYLGRNVAAPYEQPLDGAFEHCISGGMSNANEHSGAKNGHMKHHQVCAHTIGPREALPWFSLGGERGSAHV